jgi:hypothetical protein
MTSDRRSGNERRSLNRFPIELDIEWEGSGGRQPGTLSDVSLEGCFVLGSGEVSDGEQVRIFVPLADGMKVQFDGLVANHVLEIGFGVKFLTLSAAQRELLQQIAKAAN